MMIDEKKGSSLKGSMKLWDKKSLFNPSKIYDEKAETDMHRQRMIRCAFYDQLFSPIFCLFSMI